jgi:zinc transport system permease protein
MSQANSVFLAAAPHTRSLKPENSSAKQEAITMINSVLGTLAEMFSYTFLVRAFIVGALVSICAALLGVSLVLKRYSMIGDGLSHVGFGSLALATALNAAPLSVAVPLVIAAAFLLLRLGEKNIVKGDAAIALVSTSSLALGVIIISQTSGMNTDVCNYLFGSILAMQKSDVYLSIALSITVLVIFILFYHKLFAITFDETFARASGIKTGIYNMLIAFLTAITIVLGMRMMGAMLISALIIFPALSSMRIFKKYKTVSICAVCISILCFFTGIVVSYIYAMPTGASVVLINIFAFVFFWLINIFLREGKIVKKLGAISVIAALLVSGCRDGRVIAYGQMPENTGGEQAPAANVSAVPKKVSGGRAKDALVEIKEKMFLAQTNDVYLNPAEYMGKTLKLEGIFKREQYGEKAYCFVLRYGPGCCGSDGNAGFEVSWDTTQAEGNYPNTDDWVQATGTLQRYEEEGAPYLYIALTELKKLDKRGAEYVTQ